MLHDPFLTIAVRHYRMPLFGDQNDDCQKDDDPGWLRSIDLTIDVPFLLPFLKKE